MLRRALQVAQISFFNDPEGRSPEQLLEAWPTLADFAEAASRSGIQISVVQACAHSHTLVRDGVRYYFLPFGDAQTIRENAALGELLRSLAPHVLHVHGLGFPREVLALTTLAPGVPIVLQDHASRPPRIWRRTSWRREMSAVAGVSFCAREQARPFVDAGVLHPDVPVYAIPESTSRFAPGDREEARRTTQVTGEPAILWVGHLDTNKDPLTVLEGISAATRTLPRLQMFCCFGTAPLLREVQNRITTDPALHGRVRLLGRVPHERVEHLMRAADLFVLGSHRESTGYSVIEALACGLPPVVTDIPSFRSLTGAGAVGMLWPSNDANALCEALRSVAARVGPEMRAAVRAHFERELSFDSLGLRLAAMYEQILDRKRAVASGASRSAQNARRIQPQP